MTPPIYRPGHIVWHDLFTTDLAASQLFYGEVVGWKLLPVPVPDGVPGYAMIQAGERQIGRIAKVPDDSMPAFWTPYISVDDVEAAGARATAAGGQVLVGPRDIPGVGRWSYVLDPQGAGVHAWKGTDGDGPQPPAPGPGDFCWDQLTTTDPAAASAFYTKVFGWTAAPVAIDPNMVELSVDRIAIATVMAATDGAPPSWVSYVVVPSLEDANKRATQHGGTLLLERLELPGMGWFSVVQDNVGAVIGLFQSA